MVGGAVLSLVADRVGARERTLRAAVLLSAWAPFATFAALLLGRSATQAADFVRRTAEFAAVLVSWLAFRRAQQVSNVQRAKIEATVRRVVGAALALSAVVILLLAVARWLRPTPTGSVVLGFAIALLGAATNGWFWARYRRFERQERSPIVAAQARLYRAKTFVDAAVLAALGSVWWLGDGVTGRATDLAGSVIVAFYLAWSAAKQLADAEATRNDGADDVGI